MSNTQHHIKKFWWCFIYQYQKLRTPHSPQPSLLINHLKWMRKRREEHSNTLNKWLGPLLRPISFRVVSALAPLSSRFENRQITSIERSLRLEHASYLRLAGRNNWDSKTVLSSSPRSPSSSSPRSSPRSPSSSPSSRLSLNDFPNSLPNSLLNSSRRCTRYQ